MDANPCRCLALLFFSRPFQPGEGRAPAVLHAVAALDPSLMSAALGFDLIALLDAIDSDFGPKRTQRWSSARGALAPLLAPQPGSGLFHADLSSLPPRSLPNIGLAPNPQQWRVLQIHEPCPLPAGTSRAAVNARLDTALSVFSPFGVRSLFQPPESDQPHPWDIYTIHALAGLFLQGVACSDERALLAASCPPLPQGPPARRL